MVKDVVCGMDISDGLAKEQKKTAKYNGKTYYFCSIDCKDAFIRNPKKYLMK